MLKFRQIQKNFALKGNFKLQLDIKNSGQGESNPHHELGRLGFYH